MIFLIIFITIIFTIYFSVILYFHRLDLPNLDLAKYKNQKVLIIFPHPDDETFFSSGLINKLSKISNTTVISTTKGEYGNEILKLSPEELGKLRSKEFASAMEILNVNNFDLWDFEDGKHEQEIKSLKLKINNFIIENEFDLVVTYEKSGMYGHMDHVILSKIIRDLSKELSFDKLLVTITKKLEEKFNPNSKMRDDINLHKFELNQKPKFKLSIISTFLLKYKALKSYKSQNLSHFVPIWASVVFMPFEYYTDEDE